MARIGKFAAITLLAAISYLVANLPVGMFWEQAGDRTFELASSSSHLMKSLPAQRSQREPQLLAHGSRGMSGEPVLLGLALQGRAGGGVVIITGLVPGMSLSSGSAVGDNAWEVPVTYLADTWIGPPENFVGVVKLIAELHLSDPTIVQRQSIDVEWIAAGPIGSEQISSTADSKQRGITTGPAGPEQVSSPADSEQVPLAPGPADPDQVSSPADSEQLRVAAIPAGPEQVSNPADAEQVPLAASLAGLEQVSSPADSEEVPLGVGPAGPDQVSSPAHSEQAPLAAGPAGPEQVSVAARPLETVPAPQPLDQNKAAMDGSNNPPVTTGHGVASSRDEGAAKSQRAEPTRNNKTAKAAASRRAPDEPFYPDGRQDLQQATHAKWQIIRHCWSRGRLVGSSSTSMTSCR